MKHIGKHPMKPGLALGALAFLIAAAGAQSVGADTCDTTRVTSETFQSAEGAVYLADCRISTDESSPFVVASGHRAFLTAEQQIRLAPGFHAERGSHFHAKLRPCIRNPEANTGAASWGNYDEDAAGVEWMKEVAVAFVENFNTGGLTAKLKYEEELAQYGIDIPDFYCDAERMSSGPASSRCVGGDDDHILLQLGDGKIHPRTLELHGIDNGVFFFHIGHGNGGVLGPSVRNGDASASVSGSSTQITWPHFRLGNCSSDGSEKGELRYLWLCSCRSFGHGPPIVDSTETHVEYDRPSEFDANGLNHANIFSRLDPLLSPNMRMACGVSTTAHCGNPNHVATYLSDAYFTEGLGVAEAWGVAHTRRHSDKGDHPLTDINGNPILDGAGNQLTRDIYQTPLCIARGNLDPYDLRSPITDDLRFSEKANPYDEALHVVYWETYASVVEMGGGVETAAAPIGVARRAAATPVAYRAVAYDAQPQAASTKRELDEEKMRRMPVLLTAPSTPVWVAEGAKFSADEQFLSSAQTAKRFSAEDKTLISKETTRDGRPKIRLDPQAGAVSLAGNRARVSAAANSRILPLKGYAEIARRFIEGQGWSESDMGTAVAVKAELQVMPMNASTSPPSEPRNVLRTQKDVTFYIGRLIPMEGVTAKVLGSDNQIVVQLNNDGSIIRASKRWKKVIGKVEGVPVKSFEDAYSEAQRQLGNPLLHDLVHWDWGYRSITRDDGREMMVLHYTFTFEPRPLVAACIDSPLVVEIQAHVMEGGPAASAGDNARPL